MKVFENVGEAISFPQTSDIVRREDTILPCIGSLLSFMVVRILRMGIYIALDYQILINRIMSE